MGPKPEVGALSRESNSKAHTAETVETLSSKSGYTT